MPGPTNLHGKLAFRQSRKRQGMTGSHYDKDFARGGVTESI